MALAEPLARSLRPVARPDGAVSTVRPGLRPRARPSAQDLITAAGLDGRVGAVVADARTGAIIEAVEGDRPLPPASVTKSLTTLYALETLGGARRLMTRVLATAEPQDGVLSGDIILAGGGDPTLSTDHLGDLVEVLAALGLTEVRGRLQVWGGALPFVEQIEPAQMDHLGYNPSVSGLNLNFNRVHFEWARSGGDYRLTMDARAERFSPEVRMAKVRVAARDVPVFAYEGPDEWSVARGALGNGGARWLPVRRPPLYAGEVFRTLAAGQGIRLPDPEEIATLPDGLVELAAHRSATLRAILKDMLQFSTNLTAEVSGLLSSRARTGAAMSIPASAADMSGWLAERFGIAADLRDHSGLSDESRLSAADMVRVMAGDGPEGELAPLLREIPMRDGEGNVIADHPVSVVAKTGTLNFVSALSGFVSGPSGGDLAFAIFVADIDRREAAKARGDEVPQGAVEWNRRARALQQQLLQRWGLIAG